MKETSVIELTRTYDVSEAHMIRGILETNNIFCTLQNDQLVGTMWHLNLAVGGVKILVARSEYEAALNILKENSVTHSKASETQPFLPQSINEKVRFALSAIATFMCGIPIPFKKRKNN